MAYRDDFYDNEDQQRRDPYAPPPQGPAVPPVGPAAPAPAPAPAAAPAPAPAPAGVYDRNQFRDAWMSSGAKTSQDLQNFVGQHQSDFGAGVQLLPGGKGDKIRLPDGTLIDAVLAAGLGGRGAAWTGDPGQMGGGNTAGAPGMVGVAGAASGAAGLAGGQGVDPAFRDALLAMMKRSAPGAIDPTSDPNLGPQSRAYAAARERSAAKERASTAERAAFTGLNSGGQGSGAFDTALHGIQENAGRDIASNDAGLVGQEVQARRQDLMNALQLANSVGARDQASQIQMQLANLDNTYKYAALNQQGNQFASQLGQQQSQFDDTYGFNKAVFQAQADRQAYLDAMNPR